MKYIYYLSLLLASCLLAVMLTANLNGSSLVEKIQVKTKKVLNEKPTTTKKTDDGECEIPGTSCWNDWHYGAGPPRMNAPYINEDVPVDDFVEFTQKELERKRECPSCCIRCVATEDPNSL